MNVENFSRKVVVCWYPTRRYWLDISDYTRYIPRVFTDGYRDHPKDGSSSTSHMKFWQEAEVEYKKLNLWYCSDGDHDHQWAATEKEPAQDMSCSVSSVSSAPVPLTRRSHLYLVLDSKQSNEPQVNKKCCGSLSIYYYDILPLDIPKYVKKLVF